MTRANPKELAANLCRLAADVRSGRLRSRRAAADTLRRLLASVHVAKAVRLDPTARRKANAALERLGLDGNKPMPSFSRGIALIHEALDIYGLVIDDIVTAPHSDDGRITYAIGAKLPEGSDPFMPPTPIANSTIAVSWHKFETTHNYEMIAYLT